MAKIPVTVCPAGPALDAAVAKVLGWTELPAGAPAWETPEGKIKTWEPTSYGVWQPSEDIAAAWELAEELVQEHSVTINWLHFWGERNWTISLTKSKTAGDWVSTEADEGGIPLAITRAFLLVHGVTEVEVADE